MHSCKDSRHPVLPHTNVAIATRPLVRHDHSKVIQVVMPVMGSSEKTEILLQFKPFSMLHRR